jgi:uncharacterized protein YjiS (DUF1127 family)
MRQDRLVCRPVPTKRQWGDLHIYLIVDFEGNVMSQATCLGAPPSARAPGRLRPATRTPGLPARGYVAWLAAAIDRLTLHRRRRAAIRDLHRLCDCDLRDIGIERGEIDAIVDEMMEIRRHARRGR